MKPSQALVLRFGADTTAMRSAIAQLAADAPRNLALISQAAIGSSRALREGLISGAADGTRGASGQLLALARNTDNLRLVAGLAGEGMKTAFALHHPVLAIGLKLLADYRVALGLVAAGALTVHEAIAIMRAQYERINQIIEGSERAGVSATLFQAWADQAEHLRLSVKDAEEAIIHAGRILEQQLRPNAESSVVTAARDLQERLGRPTKSFDVLNEASTVEDMHRGALLLVKDYQDAVAELQAQGKQLSALEARIGAVKIATDVWGEAGKKVAEGIADGSLKIDDFIEGAERAGRVWSGEILEAQKETNKALAEARMHLSKELHPEFEALETISLSILKKWAALLETLASVISIANKLASGPFGWLGDRLAGKTTHELKDLASANSDKGGGVTFREAFARHLLPPVTVDAPTPPSRPHFPGDKVEKSDKAAGDRSSSVTESIDQVERYLLSLEKENAALRGEAEALGHSNVEREQSIDIAKAEQAAKERGTALTEEERAKVLQLAEAHATLKQKVDETKKAEEQAQQRRQAFASIGESAIEKLVVDNQKLVDVLKDVVRELERAALKQALLGGDGKSGVLGTIVNAIGGVVTRAVSGGPIPTMAQGGYGPDMPASMLGQLAEGTDNWRGGWSWVGENGPELLNLPRGSQVVPNADSVDYVRSMARMVGAGRALSAPPVLVQGPRLDLSGLAMLGAGRAAPATTVNIHKAPAETRAEETTDSDGGRHININLIAGEIFERGAATPRGRAAMERYGLRPGMIKR
jgi:hypothetical protein